MQLPIDEQWTWQQAADKWLEETVHKKDRRNDKAKLRWIGQLWSGKLLREIDRETVRELAKRKLRTAKPSTVNRYLALIRAILRRAAREWQWIEKPPYIRLEHEPSRRVRWLHPEQARALLEELADHQRHPMLFTLATGLRAGNVLNLRWEQIDLKRRVCWFYADQTKNGEDISISLNDSAMAVLYARRFVHPEFVFTYQGKPLQRLTTRAWYKALKRARIKNFRWHDLRHTWASWLVQEGVPLYALQEMGGWKTASMVRRYAHLSPAHNLRYAQTIDASLATVANLGEF
ncbi:tyrosine-type recombinase/integrase [Propionivibrio soli]|uniref:tyrosine-type recombinase/integrase n=1 Tax=Propionivibrio soli TaxID=2976531 RepID=UPI0021E8D3AE|nr:site-specific integrase [Propionivibrio soli]